MRDAYIGDVGDFGKYGLLRALAGVHPRGRPELALGVVWYEAPDNGIRYLSQPERFRGCDEALFDELRRLVANSTRRISAVESAFIWPKRTRFVRGNPAEEEGERWLRSAVSLLDGCDLIFLDPSTGLADDRKWPYCTYADAKSFWKPERALVIYQAAAPLPDFVPKIADRLAKTLHLEHGPLCIQFRGLNFLVVLPEGIENASRRNLLLSRLRALMDQPGWGQFFRLSGEPQ